MDLSLEDLLSGLQAVQEKKSTVGGSLLLLPAAMLSSRFAQPLPSKPALDGALACRHACSSTHPPHNRLRLPRAVLPGPWVCPAAPTTHTLLGTTEMAFAPQGNASCRSATLWSW